jgi:glycosyltransferase involved in cell wall biosynthesis
MQRDNFKILIIGSLPPPVGGTSVSLMHLVEYLKSVDGIDLYIINTSDIHNARTIKSIIIILRILFSLFVSVRKVDIVGLHIGTNSLPTFGIIVLSISKLFRKRLIIRKFNGIDFLELSFVKRYLSLFVIKQCDLYLAQTKALVQSAVNLGIRHTKWFPTHRPMPGMSDHKAKMRNSCRRFIYIGQINSQKGINELIYAAEKLPDDTVVHIYGSLNFDITIKTFTALKRLKYKGTIEPKKVNDCLKQYDALVLPTYYYGEGYPGVILEAFSVGIPVITTRWKSIPELVDESIGIIIEPKNPEALLKAMEAMYYDTNMYTSLIKGIMDKREKFSLNYWADHYIAFCKNIRYE